MDDENDVEERLQSHQELRSRLANTWSAFFARFGRLRPVQEAAIPGILSGHSVLMTAPTAGGKTEAVVAPLCERMIQARWPNLSVLMVTPTRALVNDLYERLERPFAELNIRLGRKTGDHPLAESSPVQFLITTPESLESLLTFHRSRLMDIRAVIIDEIHLLDGTPRGDQLQILLQRLQLFLEFKNGPNRLLQRVALSATVPDPQRTADKYLGRAVTLVAIPGQREIQAHVILAEGDDHQRVQAAVAATDVFDDPTKVLVFVNSRAAVDELGQHFRCGPFANYPVFWHHGSLSRSARESAEEQFKLASRGVCVSTMTLEIGIDIGDVDLVILMGPPAGLASFLQRIGRGCRRLQGSTRVLCVAQDPVDQLVFQGLLEQAASGLPRCATVPFRRSVLIQQILAYIRQVDGNVRTLNQFRRAVCSDHSAGVASSVLDSVVADMVREDLLVNQAGVYQPHQLGWDFIQSSRIFANIDSPHSGVSLIDVDTGKPIAQIRSLPYGEKRIRVAGHSFDVISSENHQIRVRAGGHPSLAPKYDSRKVPVAQDLGYVVARRLQLSADELQLLHNDDRSIVMTWLGDLLNACLVAGARAEGIRCEFGSFCLVVPVISSTDVLPFVRRIVGRLREPSVAQTVDAEQRADLGPYFRLLSPSLQKLARQDWVDCDFLETWLAQINSVRIIDDNSDEAIHIRNCIEWGAID